MKTIPLCSFLNFKFYIFISKSWYVKHFSLPVFLFYKMFLVLKPIKIFLGTAWVYSQYDTFHITIFKIYVKPYCSIKSHANQTSAYFLLIVTLFYFSAIPLATSSWYWLTCKGQWACFRLPLGGEIGNWKKQGDSIFGKLKTKNLMEQGKLNLFYFIAKITISWIYPYQ